jgi:hypothetical protein
MATMTRFKRNRRHRTRPALPRLLAIAGTLAVAGGLSACGTSSVSTSAYSGEAKAVAQRISDFQTDATGTNQQKVCHEDLAASVLAKLAKGTVAKGTGDCESALKHQLAQIDNVELKVQSIDVTGKHASAIVESVWSGKTVKSKLLLTKESGAWKVAGLGAA